ncbi:UDP-N-acetylmuramoyl-L-alanine--D-glutamate ligase [Synechococcus sp. A10-1-5-1]|uniref:UDP-N-acetylmuramoyl-L-alanine--D-glutamate ligase n=1 Tax=Synechococcus sp. A10-1-5-1 TaxID=2936507 RepID=UPI002000B8F0|nr:UDP-N-acetylmuramoyl-L-alanine--D-glutamate ligase [Synechococcus sp. A10-1-5-1]UPM49853.1 UDP-N-acetylmuramoyl-L-alanine--D-glutamate ligase [Synechococcus sp. A10-1-5-1]
MPVTVVLGLGRSGLGAARLLARRGASVLVLESGDGPEHQRKAEDLRAEGIVVELGKALAPESFEPLVADCARVIVSPGIRWDHPTLNWLREQGIPTNGEISTAWEASRPIPWIGITGTNGKTTVTHLVAHLLERGGIDAPMCGNVGHSAAELALERFQDGQTTPQALVVELSSYQIESAPELAPAIGLWTTLTPDHLERHGTLENYRAIKRGLLERSAIQVLNADDPDLCAHAASWSSARWITAESRDAALNKGIDPWLWVEGDQVMQSSGALLDATALAMPGAHNRQNMLMAVAVGLELGLSGPSMEAALRAFPGVPHRLELIRRLNGVQWINDSKATNYDAAEVALRAVEGPLVALAGGEAKQGDASAWIAALQRKATAVVLFGAAQSHFQDLLLSGEYTGVVQCCDDLAAAVAAAQQLSQGEDCRAVLLSPACASFDQYRDFEARGEHFRSLTNSL